MTQSSLKRLYKINSARNKAEVNEDERLALMAELEELTADIDDPYLRTALQLRYARGLTWTDAATAFFNTSPEAVRKLCSRALRKRLI